jgi:predicted site-specific integrase-resolvase
MELKKLLTQQDAARQLGISRLTFSKWQKSGKVTPMGIVGTVYVYEPEYISELAKRITPHVPFQSRLAA